jgi:hypothetical protein
MKHAIHIRKILLAEMPGFRPQFRRPFDVVGRPEDNEALINEVLKVEDLVDVDRVTPSKIAPHISSFLRYSGEAQPAFPPPLGWNTPRYSFAIEVEVKPVAFSGKQILTVYGYTDTVAEVLDGKISDAQLNALTFHINSIVTARSHPGAPESHVAPYTQMVANHHYYSDANFAGNFNSANVVESLRPCDILARLSALEVAPEMVGGALVDMRTIVGSTPRASDRMNVNPAHLLAKILDGYVTALEGARANTHQSDLLEEARSRIQESPAGMNPFLRELVGDRAAGATREFKMEDLLRIDASVGERMTIVTGSNADKDLVHSSRYSDWDEESLEALIAYAVAIQVPAAMGQTGLTKLVFSLEMSGTSGNWRESGLSFSVVDLAGLLPAHDSRAKEEFVLEMLAANIPQWSGNYTIPLYMNVEASLNGLTIVDISMTPDFGKKKRFVMPSFMDGLVSPVLARKTDQMSELANVADGIGALLNVIFERIPMA